MVFIFFDLQKHPRLPFSFVVFVLLTSVAAVGGAALFAGILEETEDGFLSLTPAYDTIGSARPKKDADVVEKVRPSVVSGSVKVEAETQAIFNSRSQSTGLAAANGFSADSVSLDTRPGMPTEHPTASARAGTWLLYLSRWLRG